MKGFKWGESALETKEEITPPILCYIQTNRVLEASSKEHHTGYNRQFIQGDKVIEIYEPNTEQEFINSVRTLLYYSMALVTKKSHKEELNKIEEERNELEERCRRENPQEWEKLFNRNYKRMCWKHLTRILVILRMINFGNSQFIIDDYKEEE